MNFQERASLLYRIINGKMFYKFQGTQYILRAPDINVLTEAQIYHDQIIEDFAFAEFIPEEVCKHILIYNGVCTDSDEIRLENLNERIEGCKVDIFKSFFNIKQYKQYKIELKLLEEQVQTIEDAQHSLDYLTLEGTAKFLQQQYIITHTLYNLDNTLLFPDFAHTNFSLLQLIYGDLQDYSITVAQIREIARTDPWLLYWRVSKVDVFGKSGVYLSSDQRYLILYSQMYDNVHEHSDTPHQDIIDDDDALDGWFISERRKREQDKKENQANSMLDIHPGAQEVFIPAQSQQDIERVHSMNSVQSHIIKAQRQAVIQKLGTVDSDLKFPDKQLEAKQIAHEAMKGR